MNPTLKLAAVVIIALELSFTQVYSANLMLIIASLVFLIWRGISGRRLFWLTLIPLFFAGTLVWSLAFQGTASTHFLIVIFTRFFMYVYLGATLTLTTSPIQLIQSLEQNAHLPAKFAYGFLAAFNLLPKIKHEVITIRAAAQMYGVTLHVWSARLYFKVILSALSWSDQLASAMASHGFSEGAPRTHAVTISLSARDWWLFIASLLIVQGLVFSGLP